jgi:hypothetical protein
MSFPSIEVRLIATFKEGLKEAVSDDNSVDWDDVDPITEQKLLLMGIREFGLEDEVTIQWYADGDVLAVLEPGNRLPDQDEGQIESPREIAITGEDGGEYPTVDKVATFYHPDEGDVNRLGERNEAMPEIIREDTFQWLQEYYESRDGPFKKLYQTNLDIHLHNYRCKKACNPNTDVELPDDLVQPLVEATDEMKRELLRYRIFDGMGPYVTEFRRVAVSVMEWCEEQEIRSMDEEDRVEYEPLLSHLNTFYYQALWKSITRIIAVYTIEGPEAYFEQAADWGRLDTVREKYLEVFGQLEKRADDHGVNLGIREERLPELWIKKEGISKEDFLNWDIEDSLPEEEVKTISDDDPAADLLG